MSWCQESSQGCTVFLYIQPGARKTEIVGLHGEDRLKIKVQAPPEDGEANGELIRFLAEHLSVAKSRVEILRGHKSRKKDVFIQGLSQNVVLAWVVQA